MMVVVDLSQFRDKYEKEEKPASSGVVDLTPFSDRYEKPDPVAESAGVNLSLSADSNPDEKARARTLATQTGWPSPLVESDPKAAESWRDRPDFQSLDTALSTYLAESPDHAAISKDDLPALDKVAKSWRLGIFDEKAGTETRGVARRPEDVKTREAPVAPYTFGDVAKSGATRVAADVGLAFTGLGEATGGAIQWITRDRAGQETTEYFAEKSEKLREIAASAFGQKEYEPDAIDSLVQAGASQAAFWTPSVAVRLAGATVAKAGPLAAKAAMYGADAWGVVSEALTEAGGTYKELRAGGASQEKSADVASKVFWSNVAVIALSNKLGVLSGEGIPQGALFEGGQEAFQTLAPEAAKSSEGLPTRPAPEIAEETVMSAFMGALLGGPVAGIVSAAPKASEPITSGKETEQFIGRVSALNAAVNEAKTFTRAPDLMEKFLTEHVGIGDDVYISGEEARELYQANGPLLEKLGVNQATVEEAASLGGDVKMPMSKVLALPAEEFSAVADSLKAGPAAYSKKEAAALSTPESIERETQRFAREAERQVEYQRELSRVTAEMSNAGLSGEEVKANTALVDAWARGIEAMGGDRVKALKEIGTIRQAEEGAERIPGELESYLTRARRRAQGESIGRSEDSPSLVSFLVKQGGLRDAGGEIKALESSRPGLISKTGKGLDRAALNAWEAGYFPEFPRDGERPPVDALVTAIRDEIAGSPRYSETVAAEDRMAKNADIDGFEAWLTDRGLTLESPDAEIAKAWEGELNQAGRPLTPPTAEIESLIAEAEGIEDAEVKQGFSEALGSRPTGAEINARRERVRNLSPEQQAQVSLSDAAEAYPGFDGWLIEKGVPRNKAIEIVIDRWSDDNRSAPHEINGETKSAIEWYQEWVGDFTEASREKFQSTPASPGRRGRTFWRDGKANIEVFKNAADASTIPHELAHVFLEQFRDIATTIQGTDQAYADWAVLKEWLGITDDSKPLTVEQHEQFAEGFEAYLQEGRAPSKKLESVFIRFKNWLLEVYKSALALNVPLTDDVRSVYGRLLAAQEETDFASAQLGLTEVSDLEAGNLGLSDDEKAHARRVLKSAKDTAVALLDKDRNRDLAKKKKQWALDAADEASNERVYRLRASLTAQGQGLDIDMVRDEYGTEAVAEISRKRPGSIHSDGRTPGAVAFEFGYASTGEMIEDLRTAPSKAERIDQILEAKQKAHDAEFSAQESLLESEAVAEYLDVLGRLLSKKSVTEERKRARGETQARRESLREAVSADDDLTRQAAQVYAMQTVEGLPVKAATNNRGYVAAMARALKNVSRFVISGNVARAREENDKAKVNYHLARESLRAKKKVDKVLSGIARVTKSETIHVDFSDAIKELAARYGLAKVRPTNADVKPLKVLANSDAESPDLSSAPIDDWMENRNDRRNYKDLSFGELSDLYDAIKWLEGEGRRRLQGDKAAMITIEGSLEDVQAKMLPEMEKVSTKKGIRQSDPLKRVKQIVRNLSATNMQLLWLTRTWDNFQNFGKDGKAGESEKIIYGTIRDGAVEESRIKSDWGVTLLDMVTAQFADRIGKLDRPKRISSEVEYPVELRTFYNEEQWSFLDVLTVALNMGNEHNMTAVMEGYRKRDGSIYTRDDLMRLTSILTKEDWQAIQAIGNHISSAYPELAAAYKKINYGVDMKRVEPTPFVNPQGEVMRGWYFPLMADSNIFKQAAKEESKEAFLDMAATAFRPAVRKGSTLTRKKSFGGRPVSLNALNTITRHVDFVAKYVAWGGRIRDLDRILQSEPIANEITRISGPEMYGRKAAGGRSDERATLRGHLKRLAGRDEQLLNDADRAAMWLKHRTTPIILLRNPLRIATTQTAGLIRAVSEVGAGSLANGYIYGLAMNGGPRGTHQFIMENSPRMAARMGRIDQAFVDHQKFVSSRPEGWVKTSIEKTEEILAKPSTVIDAMVLEPVWMDTYMKALKSNGGNHAAAVSEADGKVEGIQPFFEEMDRSAIQSSKTMGAAITTFFFSDAAQQSNRYAYATRGWRSGAISTPAFIRMMFYEGVITPAYINVLRAAMYGTLGGAILSLGGSGGRDDEEKKTQLLSDIGWDIVAERFRGTPYVKDILNVSITAARAKIEDKPMRTQQFTPLAHGPNLFVNAVATTADILTADKYDPKKKEKYIFALADLLSFGTGIPVSGVAKELYRTIDQIESGKGGPGKYIGIPTPDYLLKKGR